MEVSKTGAWIEQSPGQSPGQSLPSWLRRLTVLLLLLGLFFRFFNLDRKIYWLDETYTSLRLSGYTRTELVQQMTGEPISVEQLRPYQQLNPERGLIDTFKGLASEEPQLTPLYFTLVRFWAQQFGDSVGAIRSLSAVISLLVFPSLGWLCLELFQSWSAAWMAIGLFAVSPLQVLYAQEARPYSLWAVTILFSSAVLLWAIRSQNRWSWPLYAVTVALGLYTHLLFGLVLLAHTVYIIIGVTTQVPQSDQQSHSKQLKQLVAYGLATGAGCLTLLPWLILLYQNFSEAEAATAGVRESTSIAFLLNQWGVNSSRVFVGWDLGPANLIFVLGLLYSLYWLYTKLPKQKWLLLSLVAVPFLLLALPDLFLEGLRSTRIRYLIPCYMAMLIAIAYSFSYFLADTWSSQISLSHYRRRYCQAALVFLITVNIIACSVSAEAVVWWNKSVPRSSYYPPVAEIINQANMPLVISDSSPMEVLALSRWLEPAVKLKLIAVPQAITINPGFKTIFLLNPSQRFQMLMQQDYDVQLVYKDKNAPRLARERLWQLKLNSKE